MRSRIYFVTGTDTGVGKTVLTVALARHLVRQGETVAAVKPFCSGGRSDASALWNALGRRIERDVINPWSFKAPLAPRIAADLEQRPIGLSQVVAHVRAVARQHSWTLVEGAGGLLSPWAADGDAPDAIAALRARPIVVCPNRLGAINQTLLVMTALPRRARTSAQIVLMQRRVPDLSARSNLTFLRSELGSGRVHEFPWLAASQLRSGRRPPVALTRMLDALIGT